ncbi:MAG: aminotransferase class IV [Cyclobacteriaceae bacterium]|nr:aminotransferase class IV [Cyclobacteriaceae bacterium]
MCLFIESIKVSQGKPGLLELHQERLDRTYNKFFPKATPPCLRKMIALPDNLPINIVYKCRVVYGKTIENVSYTPYVLRPVKQLKIVHADDLDYSFKYEDRKALQRLFETRGDADDVLIVKNGFVTDTSYANVVLFHPEAGWVTPQHCLLDGVQRQYLLRQGKIRAVPIREEDLWDYTEARIINAMITLEESPATVISYQ